MICLRPARDGRISSDDGAIHNQPAKPNSGIYDGPFRYACASNLCAGITVALLYRYADLVGYLGGGEYELGWIVGIGMVGSLTMRFVMGRAVDRHGARTVWLSSLVLLSLVCFSHLLVRSCHGPTIYILRILLASAIAGVFGSGITWSGGRVPTARLAEIVGTLGASGFAAMAVGNYLGDVLARSATGSVYIARLFVASGSLTLVAIFFCWMATRGTVRPSNGQASGSMARILWRYSPRFVLMVGAATGIVLNLPSTFLRPFTAELGISGMATFFGVYAGVALMTRISARRFPERFGLAPVILLGLVLLAAGMMSFLLVETAWQLVIPASILGFAHALVFPPTVAASTLSFPENCRGLGTMLILAAYDVGVLVGAPLAGGLLRFSKPLGLPPYPTMFATIGTLMLLICGVYAASLLRRKHARVDTLADGSAIAVGKRSDGAEHAHQQRDDGQRDDETEHNPAERAADGLVRHGKDQVGRVRDVVR